MLLDIVKKIQVTKTYFIEKITQEYCSESGKNIQVIRLPIAHSELNPIELIWANVKNQVAKRNVTFKMTDVKRLVNEALANVTPENWKDAVTPLKLRTNSGKWILVHHVLLSKSL